ncbi:aminotransferase class I/II-fold pyridoxal phosphate-dependent enzyme [Desulforudis sp. DRI-14]
MKPAPFKLEQWFARYEFAVRLNMAASCALATTVAEILALGGPGAREEYLRLNLDYIPSTGSERLREAVAGWYRRIGAGGVQVTTGASEAIFILMNVLLEPGDIIVVEDPVYQSLYAVAESIGVRVKKWPLRPENRFRPDVDELERLLGPGVRAVVVNHPHNPTGAMLSTEDQRRLVELADRFGFWLVSDEVYRGTVYDERDVLPPAADFGGRAVSIGDMTKPFGLGGLRIVG